MTYCQAAPIPFQFTGVAMGYRSVLRRTDWKEHVPPHLVWSFIHRGRDLGEDDREHVLDCSECTEMFIICLQSASFGSALMSLRYPPEEW